MSIIVKTASFDGWTLFFNQFAARGNIVSETIVVHTYSIYIYMYNMLYIYIYFFYMCVYNNYSTTIDRYASLSGLI